MDVNVITERRLLDSKIVLPDDQPHHGLAKVILAAMVLGGLAAAIALFYLNTAAPKAGQESYQPQITIPPTEVGVPTEVGTPTAEAPPAPVQVAEILPTPTNFLNVRKGPGTNFDKIGQVKPGEAHILVSTDLSTGWYEIKLADGSTGWITNQYAQVK